MSSNKLLRLHCKIKNLFLISLNNFIPYKFNYVRLPNKKVDSSFFIYESFILISNIRKIQILCRRLIHEQSIVRG